ncbi:hydantoinase/oxoprolinase family protein, partial [Parageobacillus sp. SY1]
CSNVSVTDLEEEFRKMEQEANQLLEEEGIEPDNRQFIRFIEMRYAGQWRSLAITASRPLQSIEEELEKFHREHEREFAFSNREQKVEIFGLRVSAIGMVPKPSIPVFKSTGQLKDALKETRPVYFEETNGYVETPIYFRPDIPVDSLIEGPAIIEQLDSTVVIPPGFHAKIDQYKNILIYTR